VSGPFISKSTQQGRGSALLGFII